MLQEHCIALCEKCQTSGRSQPSVKILFVASHHRLVPLFSQDMARFFANQPHITRHAFTDPTRDDHQEGIIYQQHEGFAIIFTLQKQALCDHAEAENNNQC